MTEQQDIKYLENTSDGGGGKKSRLPWIIIVIIMAAAIGGYILYSQKESDESGVVTVETTAESVNVTEAETYLLQSLKITDEIGLIRDKLILLYEFACLLVAKGKSGEAVKLLSLVLEHPFSHQIRLGEGLIRDSANDLLSRLEDDLSKDAYMAAVERGRAMELDSVISDLVDLKN